MSEGDEARRQGSTKYSMMGRAPRQFGIGRTVAMNPGSETTDGLFGIGIGKIKAGQGTTDVNNGFYNGKQRLKAIIIIAKKEFLVLSTISAYYQQVTATVTGAVQTL